MRPKDDLPEFVREAFDAESESDPRSIERLVELFEAEPASQGLTRLMGAVAELPLRYSPFVGRLSTLWDLPEAEVEALLTRSRDARAWRKPPLRGLSVLDVQGGAGIGGASASLVRFEPGFRFPAHRHPGHEKVLVLEGSYVDSGGRRVGPGDLHEMAPGTEHGFVVAREEPCIAAAVQAGLEFTGPVMRLLQKLFG